MTPGQRQFCTSPGQAGSLGSWQMRDCTSLCLTSPTNLPLHPISTKGHPAATDFPDEQ